MSPLFCLLSLCCLMEVSDFSTNYVDKLDEQRENIPMRWFALALLACAALAQRADTRREFDVASIHPVAPDVQRRGVSFSDSQFNANGIAVRLLIEMAYTLQPFRLAGAPAWIDAELYSIQASWSAPANGNQVREMLQRLLEERFRLKLKRETKEQDTYVLRVRGETKLQPAKNPGSSGVRTSSDRENRNVRTEFLATTMERFIDILSREVGRVVVDETGLTGEYDFVLQTEREPDEKNLFVSPLAPSVGQLGLRLESRKGMVDYYTIEAIERPSEN